jgi:NAD(P)H-hydrate epimerase
LDREIPTSEEGRIDCALELAQRSNAICVLKGPQTVVTDGQQLYVNQSGSPALATAGSGDILSGMLGAYLAWSMRAHDTDFGVFEAACSAVHVHGLAGELAAQELGVRGTIASDILQWLPKAQKAFEAPL